MKTTLLALLLALTLSIGVSSQLRPSAWSFGLSLPAYSGCSSDTCG